jgi:predicted phosphodiesterase
MRVAVLSDVHSNLHALEAVLVDVDAGRFDALWFLGDLVGYGPRPNECAALLQERAAICLAGNHDLVVLGRIPIDSFVGEAAAAARWTQEVLDEPARSFLEALEPRGVGPDAELFHGSPRDPVWEYVLSTLLAGACMDAMAARVGAVGHSHVALWFRRDDGDGRVFGEQAPGGTEMDLSEGTWLINPGGVGQPRDGDARAAWLLLDLGTWRASWRRVEYPIDQAAEAINRAGLPRQLAERLFYGQ